MEEGGEAGVVEEETAVTVETVAETGAGAMPPALQAVAAGASLTRTRGTGRERQRGMLPLLLQASATSVAWQEAVAPGGPGMTGGLGGTGTGMPLAGMAPPPLGVVHLQALEPLAVAAAGPLETSGQEELEQGERQVQQEQQVLQ